MSARESDRLAALQKRAAEIVEHAKVDEDERNRARWPNGWQAPRDLRDWMPNGETLRDILVSFVRLVDERGTERTPEDLGGAIWTVDNDSKAEDLHLDGSLIATVYRSGDWLVWRPERTAPFMSGHTIRAKDAAVEELRRAGILPRKSPAAQQPADWSSIAELRAALADVWFRLRLSRWR